MMPCSGVRCGESGPDEGRRLIAVTGVLEGTIVRECVRCLKEYDDPLAFSVRAAFAREAKEPKSAPPFEAVDPRKGRPGVTKAEADVEAEDEGMINITIRAISWNWLPCCVNT